MRLPKLRTSASPRQRLHDVCWRLRNDQWERPSLLSERWVEPEPLRRIEDALAAEPIVMLDVGARGGVHDLKELRSVVKLIGFEPQEAECLPLQREWHRAGYREATFLPLALGASSGERTLILAQHPGATSFLAPNLGLLEQFGTLADMHRPVAEATVPVLTLDELVERGDVERVDLLRMDVQGSELAILSGGPRLLREHVLVVKTEICFRPLYREQPIFGRIDSALEEQGFALLGIENTIQGASVRTRGVLPDGVGDRGEWLFGDAVYVKDLVTDPAADAVDTGRVLRLMLVLESLGFVGYALDAAARLTGPSGSDAELVDALAAAIVGRHRVHWYERHGPERVVRRLAGREPYRR